MKKKKYGFGLVTAAIYIVLSCALLISFTAAKYTSVRTLFTDFRAAQFNVAILLEDMTDTGKQDTTEVLQLLELTDLRPGMTGDKAVRVPFCVSNGPDETVTAKVGIRYTIQILTAQYLSPLEFSLEESWQKTEKEVTQRQTQTYQAEHTKTLKAAEGSQDHDWYVYTLKAAALPSDQKAVTLSTDTGEPEFDLIPEKIGEFVSNQHFLVVEWPEDTGTDIQYMKEVEPIHILVTAHSINHSETENYDKKDLFVDDTYSSGLVMIKDNARATSYKVDLRAFKEEAGKTERTFTFWVDNGIGHGNAQTRDRINYGVDMLLPLEKTNTADGWKKLDLTFQMSVSDGKYQIFTVEHYRIYNEKTGLPVTEENGTPKEYSWDQLKAAELEPDQWPYAFYEGGNGTLQNYELDDANNKYFVARRNLHTLTVTGNDVDRITDESLNDDFSFRNKVELLIAADFLTDETVKPETEPKETESTETEPKVTETPNP